MVLFGVPTIDRVLGKPPAHVRLAVWHDPGIDPTPLLWHTVQTTRKAGGDVVIVATSRSPGALHASLGRFLGAELEGIHWVDAHSGSFYDDGMDVEQRVRDPESLASITRAVRLMAKAHPGATLIIDSLSTLIDRVGIARFEEEAEELLEIVDAFSATVTTIADWPYDMSLGPVLGMFDGVLRMEAVEDQVIRNQTLRLHAARWTKGTPSERHLWATDESGHVRLVVPKLVITGPDEAGKTTFIHKVSRQAVSAERQGTTVALDRGHFEAEGLQAELFGTPGQARFDPLLGHLLENAVGVILMVDASDPSSFERAKQLLDGVLRRGVTTMVLANKQDAPGALAPDDVGRRLGVPTTIPVLGCSTQDQAATRDTLEHFLDSILQEATA